MKTRSLFLILTCIFAVIVAIQNLQQSIHSSGAAVSFSLNDLFLTAQADGESGGSCSGSTCDDANGNIYNTVNVGGNLKCCGISWTTRGKKS